MCSTRPATRGGMCTTTLSKPAPGGGSRAAAAEQVRAVTEKLEEAKREVEEVREESEELRKRA
ncbi:MAG: hypothetical protein VX992_07240, partial [Acidobacteriota bacterium]|nr:hypothetical protein [Acidobacteriota bacterium]